MAKTDWLLPLRVNRAAKFRLLCFPYAGGGPTIFRAWPDLILPDVEVWAAQPPGREGRINETPASSITPVIEGLLQAMAALNDRPFAFFGHSMGALLAFELSHALRRAQKKEPFYLFVSGAGAPHMPRRRADLHHLEQDAFVEGLRRMNGVPKDVLENKDLFAVFAPTLRADLTLCETYAPSSDEPLKVPISAIGGLEDADVLREDLEAWKKHTRLHFQVRMLPGDHFFIDARRPETVEAVSRELFKHAPRR